MGLREGLPSPALVKLGLSPPLQGRGACCIELIDVNGWLLLSDGPHKSKPTVHHDQPWQQAPLP